MKVLKLNSDYKMPFGYYKQLGKGEKHGNVITFSIPASRIFLISTGSVTGVRHISIEPQAPKRTSANVIIEVYVDSRSPKKVKAREICRGLDDKSGEWGVGIFTPRKTKDQVHIDIKVYMPQRHFSSLMTDLPMTVHYIDNQRRTYSIDYIGLTTNNANIHAENMTAAYAKLVTETGSIVGTFVVSSELDLAIKSPDHNSKIAVDVLLNPGEDGRRPFFKAENPKGMISARLRLRVVSPRRGVVEHKDKIEGTQAGPVKKIQWPDYPQ